MGPWCGEREREGKRKREREVEEGGGCDVFINKKQLCMMLTAGWSAPRPNPALLLLTFQRSGAYPRQCAQSSLSRSSSVQGSGGGQPWLSFSYQSSETHSNSEDSLQILYVQASTGSA